MHAAPLDAPAKAHSRHRHVIAALKLTVAVGIFAVLFYRLRGEDVFQRLVDEPKHWGLLAAAQLLVVVGFSLNYLRWFVLVRALELNFRVADAFRLGSLGLMLNQVSPGSVGGDLFKAVAIAREQPSKRTEAVASVVIDRVVGLYAMLLVATAGYLLGRTDGGYSPALHTMATVVMALAAAGTIGIAMLMTPAFTGPRVRDFATSLPAIGHTLGRLVDAAGAYRSRRQWLFAGIALGCTTHTLFVASIWMIGQGLPVSAPSLAATFVIGPLSLAASAIPLTPSGLGTFEAAMDEMYRAVGAGKGDGLLVAITYRVMTYVMAGLGAIYYLQARKAVAEVIHEAEDVEEQLG